MATGNVLVFIDKPKFIEKDMRDKYHLSILTYDNN